MTPLGLQMPKALVPALLLLGLIGCGGSQPKAANPTRPVDEPRALRIIANTLREGKLEPVPKRSVQLLNGRAIEIDVGVAQHRFGVAYVTQEERPTLEGALPAQTTPDALVVLRGLGPEVDTRILILLAENYMSDDSVGDEREATTVAAEQRISRDVRDFIYQAVSEKWP